MGEEVIVLKGWRGMRNANAGEGNVESMHMDGYGVLGAGME